jgi:3-deoxy-D-manno-octulosonate 8-phosphate phosphatase (KDO 8-P phosphatase)
VCDALLRAQGRYDALLAAAGSGEVQRGLVG